MKKTTLSEAANMVVQGLPQEELQDLHERLNIDQQRVLTYLDSFLKNVKKDADINLEEAKEMFALCEEELENMFIPTPRTSVEHLQWSILYNACEAILEDMAKASTKRTVKDSLAAMPITVKLDRYYT